jgi:hypothetical protein
MGVSEGKEKDVSCSTKPALQSATTKSNRISCTGQQEEENVARVLVREVAKEEKEISVVGLVTKPSFLSNPA